MFDFPFFNHGLEKPISGSNDDFVALDLLTLEYASEVSQLSILKHSVDMVLERRSHVP